MGERRSRRVPPGPLVSDGVGAHLAGPDADRTVDRRDPDLAVTDLARAGGTGDDLGDLLGFARLAQDLDLDLGHEVDLVLGTAVGLGVAALATEPLHLGDRQAG